MKGIMKGQMLHLRKIEDHPNKWHTCYEVICQNTWNHHCPNEGTPEATIDFCYPAVVITGMPKCGTSATYDLLSRYSGAILMFEKENCPYTRRRSHWEYFHTLPRAHEVTPGRLLIDGCIDTQKNLMLRRLLHEPETLYIVMTRNYADMVWSSYNFWCKREYDGFDCDNTRWVSTCSCFVVWFCMIFAWLVASRRGEARLVGRGGVGWVPRAVMKLTLNQDLYRVRVASCDGDKLSLSTPSVPSRPLLASSELPFSHSYHFCLSCVCI
jgi:hypothetical protein